MSICSKKEMYRELKKYVKRDQLYSAESTKEDFEKFVDKHNSFLYKANDSLRELDRSFAENNIFGIEKDYRLARVSKISLFMHGAGEGNIIFGDGLENYPDKNIKPNTFDILVANPPYSVSAFKPHLKLKNNSFSILDTISNNGSEKCLTERKCL